MKTEFKPTRSVTFASTNTLLTILLKIGMEKNESTLLRIARMNQSFREILTLMRNRTVKK